MAKDKNKVAPADGALVETVWKSTNESDGLCRQSSHRAESGTPSTAGEDGVEVDATARTRRKFSFPRRSSRAGAEAAQLQGLARRRTQEKSPKSGNASKKKKKSKSEGGDQGGDRSPQRGKQFKAPTQKRNLD